MGENVKDDIRHIRMLSCAIAGFLAAGVVVEFGGLLFWDWTLAATCTAAAALWGGGMLAAIEADRIKKQHDIETWRELSAWMDGQSVDRSKRRESKLQMRIKALTSVQKVLFFALFLAACSALGFAVGLVLAHLAG